MLVKAYDAFIERTDLTRPEVPDKREDIGIYGLVGEVGALTSAVKRRRIAESGGSAWNAPNDEIREELGDSLWYLAFLSIFYGKGTYGILQHDINHLRVQLQGDSEKDKLFQNAIGPARVSEFLNKSRTIPDIEILTWDQYANIAIITARTEGQEFLGVCLSQYS